MNHEKEENATLKISRCNKSIQADFLLQRKEKGEGIVIVYFGKQEVENNHICRSRVNSLSYAPIGPKNRNATIGILAQMTYVESEHSKMWTC